MVFSKLKKALNEKDNEKRCGSHGFVTDHEIAFPNGERRNFRGVMWQSNNDMALSHWLIFEADVDMLNGAHIPLLLIV